jgi:hypothetical protein
MRSVPIADHVASAHTVLGWEVRDGRAKIAWFLDPDGNNLSISEHVTG